MHSRWRGGSGASKFLFWQINAVDRWRVWSCFRFADYALQRRAQRDLVTRVVRLNVLLITKKRVFPFGSASAGGAMSLRDESYRWFGRF